jgi:hypothetical protein
MTTIVLQTTSDVVSVVTDNKQGPPGPRGPQGLGGTIGAYLSAIDTSDQPIIQANTPQKLNIGTQLEATTVELYNSRVIFKTPGTYNLSFSIQFTNSENNVINRASVWLKYNGENYPNSTSHFDIPAFRNSKPGELVGTVNFLATATGLDDYVEIYWEATSQLVSATTIESSRGIPDAPSVILTVQQVMYTQTADVTPQLAALRDETILARDTSETYRDESLEYKDLALGYSESANSDRIQTGLDVVATAENRTQTGLDVIATAQDRIQTNLDAVATAQDRVQTNLDRTQTNLDKLATSANLAQTQLDRAQTNLDREATAQDRVQTGLDAIATAADRVQTGLDVIATGEDRVATGQDKLATAADRVQTGLDVIATGEDRVQTGLDVATTLDYKDASEVAAAAALTNSQVAGEHRVAAGGFADSAEQSAIQAQASLQNILDLGDMTFITVEGAGLITRAGVPFTLTLIKRDSYIDYQVAATGGTVTLDNEIVTYIGTTLGTQTITISAGAATRVITLEVVTNELGSAPEPAPAIGDPLEGGFYAGAVMDTVTTATGSFALSTTAVTLTIPPADLPKFYIGQQIRLGVDPTQGGSSAGLAEGIVIAGTGNQLSLDITNVLFGSGITFSSWIIAAGWKIIVAPRAQGDGAGVAWKTATTAGPVQTQTLTNGVLATSSMADLNIDTTIYPLAKWVTDINIGGGINGFQDWYIPARDELELIWRNLKPITNANYTIGRPTSAITYNRDANISTLGQNGTNDNSLPPGSAYTADIPTQTSITIFRTGGLEAMQNAVYWSSTEFSSNNAWNQYFNTSYPGTQINDTKNNSYRARAVRRSIL